MQSLSQAAASGSGLWQKRIVSPACQESPQPELVVFDQSLVELMALRRTEDGIDGAWQTPVGGKAATNLASVDLGGGITLGVGRDDGVLRIWLAP